AAVRRLASKAAASARSRLSSAPLAARPAALQSGICPSNSCRPASTAKRGSALKYSSRKRAANWGQGSLGGCTAGGATAAGRLQAVSTSNSVSGRTCARSRGAIICGDPSAEVWLLVEPAHLQRQQRAVGVALQVKLDRPTAHLAIFHVGGLVRG